MEMSERVATTSTKSFNINEVQFDKQEFANSADKNLLRADSVWVCPNLMAHGLDVDSD